MFSKKTIIAGAISCLFLFSPVAMAKEVIVQEARDGVVVVDTDSIYEIERGRFNVLIALKWNEGKYKSWVIKYKLFNDGWRYYGKLSKNSRKPTWNNTWRVPMFQKALLVCIPHLRKERLCNGKTWYDKV